jgi:chromosome segregation ATPase
MPTSSEQYIIWLDSLERERDELRAQVEWLKAQAAHLARDRRLLHDEVERLRAAIVELQQDVERLQQQRAEQMLKNEQLREGLVNAGRQLAATEDSWQAEVERLRAGLEAMDEAMAGHPIYETSALQRQVQGLIRHKE